MTYHPVTKEEIEQIYANCACPDIHNCEVCAWGDPHFPLYCGFSRGRKLRDKVLSRPDPLALLEAWVNKPNIGGNHSTIHMMPLNEMIQRIRTNPDAVIARGKEEGWLK